MVPELTELPESVLVLDPDPDSDSDSESLLESLDEEDEGSLLIFIFDVCKSPVSLKLMLSIDFDVLFIVDRVYVTYILQYVL